MRGCLPWRRCRWPTRSLRPGTRSTRWTFGGRLRRSAPMRPRRRQPEHGRGSNLGVSGRPATIRTVATDDFTPPFPAYTSGHATMGGAIFKSLELFYGTNDFSVADAQSASIRSPGSTRCTRRNQAVAGRLDVRPLHADGAASGAGGLENSPEGENSMSRIYLGVHWRIRPGRRPGAGPNAMAQYVGDELLPGGAGTGHVRAGMLCGARSRTDSAARAN